MVSFFLLELSFFYAEGPSVCHIPLFLMRQGLLLYAVGCFSLCYRGLVLMPFVSGDGSNPEPDPWEDPKAESASFALYNPALNSTARVV